MKKVFISYRQTSDTERSRVRDFAEHLRSRGIEVILDQFLLDEKPAGPDDGWDKWSSDRALQTDHVIIIGSQSWFECFEKNQKPGTGLGAACEADDLRHRIYEANGIVENIRIVLFDDVDAKHISSKLKRYHRFHVERDFSNIVRWLGGAESIPVVASTLHTTIAHNLPTLQPFFGREDELQKIADALDPESRTWGALIDGPGGMGKTSLAVRAAYDAPPENFQRIIFISLKSRELDDDGVRDLSGFLISGLAELFGELARELKREEILKTPEDQRPRLLLDALRDTKTLLILDNLESLLKKERDTVFTFVKKLPSGCKAILTSRGRIGSGAEELILEKLSESAALATLKELAKHNPALAKASAAERIQLYQETGGKPLLLRWTAGQLGRGHCLTVAHALDFLRSCPEGNDPLEFIFGDLIQDFCEDEAKTLCALSFFTLPAKIEHIAPISGITESECDMALRLLVNRSLVVPSDEFHSFSLVPMVADFLRQKKPELVEETGIRLENHAYALIIENGYKNYTHFPALEAAWPNIAPALPIFLAGDNTRLQTVCDAFQYFFRFRGQWDEWLVLCEKAEARALAAADYLSAGWRAYNVGCIFDQRRQANEVIKCAERADFHWKKANVASEKAAAKELLGHGYQLNEQYAEAISAYQEALELRRSISPESANVAMAIINDASRLILSGQATAAKEYFMEALRIVRANNDLEGATVCMGNLARLAISQMEFPTAEDHAREALALSEQLGGKKLIADHNQLLAIAKLRQCRVAEALPHAQRAVEIFTSLGSLDQSTAENVLKECRKELALQRLNPGWTYNTTTLEGNSLTLEETRAALENPDAEFPERPKEHVAMTRAQGEAEKWLADRMLDPREWTEADLFRLHTILMQGSTVDIYQPIGAWKIEDNGTTIKLDGKLTWNDNYATSRNVCSLMGAWLREFNQRREGKGDTLEDHIYLHATFTRIHPFADGNGRMARLLANVPLLAACKFPVNISPADREHYLESLARWQIACGPPLPNEPLMARQDLLNDFENLCRSRVMG